MLAVIWVIKPTLTVTGYGEGDYGLHGRTSLRWRICQWLQDMEGGPEFKGPVMERLIVHQCVGASSARRYRIRRSLGHRMEGGERAPGGVTAF